MLTVGDEQRQRVALVTGTLAASSVRRVAAMMAGVDVRVFVLNIQVAALMTADWLSRKLQLDEQYKPDRIILPGYVKGDLEPIAARLGVPVERGPRDVWDLQFALDGKQRETADLNQYDIEIIAEVNDAAHMPMQALITMAQSYHDDGANVIDLGCDPHTDRPAWGGVEQAVRELCDRGMRVSVDSFHLKEIELAARGGAELVLSVNATNRDAAGDWGVEVVAIPDQPDNLSSLYKTIEQLEKHGVRYRIDPVLSPIGFGFAQSLGRYLEVRKRYPQAAMMMGVGNLTELTDVDSAGVNAVLVGFCHEVGIGSVLTTQVINWARSSVREIDAARRIMRAATQRQSLPKHIDDRLVMLRDPKLRPVDEAWLNELAATLTDKNIRIFADHARGLIHAMNKHVHAQGDDPFVVFDELGIDDASHAFYLGFEMAKAMTALTLGKNYTQDQALQWGMLTRDEVGHHERRTRKK